MGFIRVTLGLGGMMNVPGKRTPIFLVLAPVYPYGGGSPHCVLRLQALAVTVLACDAD